MVCNVYFVNIGFSGEILIDLTSNNNIDINDVYGIQVILKTVVRTSDIAH